MGTMGEVWAGGVDGLTRVGGGGVGMRRAGSQASGTTKSLSPSSQRPKGAFLSAVGLLWPPCLWSILPCTLLIGVKFQNVRKGTLLVIP